MSIKPVTKQDKEAFNNVVSHPLQTWEWGEFREKTGLKVIRRGIFKDDKLVSGFQVTIHPIPHTPFTIGYLPKGEMPNKEILNELQDIGRKEKCIFIQIEPNIIRIRNQESGIKNGKENESNTFETLIHHSKFLIQPSAHPLFTKYTFVLDLIKSEEELLKSMHPKTRYNIKVAQRHGVKVTEDNSQEAFETYWKLTEDTTKRQSFYAHTKRYHELQWETFPHISSSSERSDVDLPAGRQGSNNRTIEQSNNNHLTSHLFTATYQGKVLTTMLFFVFHDTLYYPYGASSNEFRNVMHSTLTMWEAIRWGKIHGLKKLDMWGALRPDPDPKDTWIGFHTFKERFGAEHVEFVGSYDLIINPFLYRLYVTADKLRWVYLRIRK